MPANGSLSDRELWLSLFTWAAILAALIAAFSFRTHRRPSLIAFAASAVVIFIAGSVPPRLYEIAAPETNLDEFAPYFEFREYHATLINAPQHRVDPAIRRAVPFDTMRRAGFQPLADAAGCEIVYAIEVWPNVTATINFLLQEANRNATYLSTETRVHAATPAARARFARYWRIIYPGSALLRLYWLHRVSSLLPAAPSK